MDRQEAVLRELNLYPQWVRRNPPAPKEEALPDTASASVVTAAVTPGMERAADEALPAAEVAQSVLGASAALPVAPVPQEAVAITEVPLSEEYAPDLPMPDDEHWGASMPGVVEAPDLLSALDWNGLKQKVHDCTACKLRAGCSQTVFGVGDERADWLFVGEAPGEEEDARGEPFVGQAGRLLDNMLLALKLKRNSNVYIANIVKCRPPENRVPDAEEVAACLPYLHRQIALIQPKVIVALGKTAATALLGHKAALGPLRGMVHDVDGIPMIATYHPAYLLRSPLDKARAWQDLCLARKTMLAGRQD